ncbi:MAG: hypothetical protein WBE18_03935 [Gammaproteobacteria bacterium]
MPKSNKQRKAIFIELENLTTQTPTESGPPSASAIAEPLSLSDLPEEIHFLIFQQLSDINDFSALALTDRLHQERVMQFLNQPKDIRQILNIFDSLLSTEGKSPEQMIQDNKKVRRSSLLLNQLGLVEQIHQQKDEASVLLYALTTMNIHSVNWHELVPLISDEVSSLGYGLIGIERKWRGVTNGNLCGGGTLVVRLGGLNRRLDSC